MWVKIKSGGIGMVGRDRAINTFWGRTTTSGRIGIHVNEKFPKFNYQKILEHLGL